MKFIRFVLLAGLLMGLSLFTVGCAGKTETTRVVTDRVYISEVMSTNSYYAQLPDGSCCDWVEFYNSSETSVNLKGCMLSDNPRIANKWKIPTDFVIEPDGYGVVYLSGLNVVDEAGNLHANFKLSSKGETLVFSNALGDVIQQLSIPECTLENVSYGAPEGEGDYVWFAVPSPGEANTGNTADAIEELVLPQSGLRLNEYMTKNTYVIYDDNSQYSDWVEIYNSSENDINLKGYALSDSSNGSGKWFFPKDAVIRAGDYLVVFCTDEISSQEGVYHADFKLGEGDTLTLYSLAGTVVDSVEIAELNPNISCGRDSESGAWKLFASPTPGRANTTYSYELTSFVTAEPVSSLYVSEAMCVSASGRKYSRDFIEIHNISSKPVSLAGYALAKSIDGEKFIFPSMKLPAKGYEVVYCTGVNSTVKGKLTAAFKLGQDGEDIYLFDREGRVIDILSTGKQTYGHSSGRRENRVNDVCLFDTPSPGEANRGKMYDGYASMPVFSSEGGYVQSGFELTISIPKDCTVYYTTNGEEPTSASAVYRKPISIQKNKVVKAVSYREGSLPSQTVSATFLIEDPHSIPFVSVSADPDDLFSKATGIMSDNVGGLFPDKPNYESDDSRYVTFEYYIDGKRCVGFNAMARIFGETSRKEPQKSLALILSEQCGENDVFFPFFGKYASETSSALLLRPSGQDWLRGHMRDELSARLVRDSTICCDYQEVQPVALYINGRYWGLYYLREKLNEEYLVHKYGMTKGQIDIVKWEREQQAGNRQGYLDLCEYCRTHDLTVQKNYDYVCSQIDLDSLMDWWIFETYVGNNDTGNIRCYRDQNDGKWRWMLFDLDCGFSLVTYRENYIKKYMSDGAFHGLAHCNNDIPRNLLRNKTFRKQFIIRYFHHVKTTFAPDRVKGVIDELSAEIEDEIPRQAERWSAPTESYWRYNIKTIKMITDAKPEMAKQQIKEAFRLSSKQVEKYYNMA